MSRISSNEMVYIGLQSGYKSIDKKKSKNLLSNEINPSQKTTTTANTEFSFLLISLWCINTQ